MNTLIRFAALGLLAAALPTQAHELTLKVDSIRKVEGSLLVAVYDQQAHFDANQQWVAAQKVKVTQGPMRISLGDVPAGHYAVKLFQDINENGQIDFAPSGMPSEPYGFSNNAGVYGPPSFDEAKVEVGKTTEIEIQLR